MWYLCTIILGIALGTVMYNIKGMGLEWGLFGFQGTGKAIVKYQYIESRTDIQVTNGYKKYAFFVYPKSIPFLYYFFG